MSPKLLLSLPHSLFLIIPIFLALPQVQAQGQLSGRANRQLQQLVEFNEVFRQGHTGFCLYELETETHLFGYNADRRFVPASNIKLLTFLVANRLLGHRGPALFYQESTDRIEAWGTGYPLALHPAFVAYDELGPWLSAQSKPITLNFPAREGSVARYGPGWSWDDYNDAYVYERSAFPLFGNRLYLDVSPIDAEGRQTLLGSPPTITSALRQNNLQEPRILRSEFANDFTLSPDFFDPDRFPLERPLHISGQLLTNELSAAYPNLQLSISEKPYPPNHQFTSLTASLPDTVFRQLLQDSDNFLAEQLLLQAAAQRYGLPDTRQLTGFVKDSILPALGIENIRWVDGSGLSRYNLITPRHLLRILQTLKTEVGLDRLLSLLPAGGKNGTLEKRFANKPTTYVWAKTGSLSGVACVSGFLKSRKGRWLAFSFMHNNFVGSSRPFYDEMERTLSWCYENL
ncbi:MAG: D-alanyl-D-alanine carboxypeptidase [Bacteroidota bacterium]